MTWKLASILPAWILAAVAAVVIWFVFPVDEHYSWLAIALGAVLLVTFAIQLGTRQKDGFVTRVTVSVAGAAIILAIATLIVALVD